MTDQSKPGSLMPLRIGFIPLADAAALLIAVREGVWVRCRVNRSVALGMALRNMMDALSTDINAIEEDRRLEPAVPG